jgi:predicted AlkP superfamily pyrophosphatase or phosphodiesterase
VWYCYWEDIKTPTLWDAAAARGWAVGNVSWPVSVGAPAIRFNIPEYNLTRTDEDIKMTRAVATPGLMAELGQKAGPYLTDANQAVPRDWSRVQYALEMIRQKHPRFLTVHLAAPDHLQHRDGPFTPAVDQALEEIDTMVGQLTDAFMADDPTAVVSIVSDHGFAKVDHVLWLDSALIKAGLITLKTKAKTIDDSIVEDWIAKSWLSGGSAAIVLKNPSDQAARAKVKDVLTQLAGEPANGIVALLDEPAINALGGAPTAQFWVDMRPGFMVGATLNASIVTAVSVRGTHGYLPGHDEMGATFMIRSAGIRPGTNLGTIDMRTIAPTLAALMNFPFPSAEVPALNLLEPSR